MERDELTFEEARLAGAKRLEKFVRFVFGNSVEVVNTFDKPAPDTGETDEHSPSA